MIKITEENLKDLKFDGIIVGIPSYVEVDQHKDISFKIQDLTLLYNNDKLPNGLLPINNKEFQFTSYSYFKFDNLEEFCEWYLQHKGMEIWTHSEELRSKIKDITPNEKSEITPVTRNLLEWYDSEKPSKIIRRKDRLKEVREYVQQVMNIEYYKNYSLYKPDTDEATQELTKTMVKNLKKNLINWLEEEV